MSFPSEIWVEVFKFFGPVDVTNCSLVCKLWYRIISTVDDIWEVFSKAHFEIKQGNMVLSARKEEFNWREYYISKVLFQNDARTRSSRWERVGTEPYDLMPRSSHTATLVNDRVYLIGAEPATENFIHVLYPGLTAQVKDIPNTGFPQHFARHAAVLYQNKIYTFAGLEPSTHTKMNNVFAFDTDTHQCVEMKTHGSIPEVRADHAGCLVRNRMFVFWGSSQIKNPIKEIHTLNLDSMEWELFETRGAVPQERSGHSVIAKGDKVIVYSGGQWFGIISGWDKKFHDLHILDTVTHEWLQVNFEGPLPFCSTYAALALKENFLFVIGGSAHDRGFVSEAFSCFDLVAMRWYDMGRKDFGARDHACVVFFESFAYLFFGNPKTTTDIRRLEMPWITKLAEYRRSHQTAAEMVGLDDLFY